MARAKTNKLYRTFVKGLITEAGYLTYPEDASTNELNTVLSRKGNRTRRLGIDYEDGHDLIDVDWVEENKYAIKEFVWTNANDKPDQNFLIVQIGDVLHFFKLVGGTVSTNKAPFTVSLLSYKTVSATNVDVQTTSAEFASGAGYLFVAHPYCETLNIEYIPDEDTLVVVGVVIQIRDLKGVDDGLANDEEPATLSTLHHYNLLNQGWGPAISSYYYNPYSGTGSDTGLFEPFSAGRTGSYHTVTN